MTYPWIVLKTLIRTGIARFLPSVRRLLGGDEASLRHYSDRVLLSPFAELSDLAEFLERAGPDAIDLTLGSPRFDAAPIPSLKLPEDRRGWPSPWGSIELRQAIAARVRDEEGREFVPEDEVLVTQGATGALRLAVESFLNPGDVVVLFDPSSPIYRMILRHAGVRVRWLPTWMEDGRTRFRREELISATRGARMIVVPSPGNPTGGVLSAVELEQIAWWAHRRDMLLFHDAAFRSWAYDVEVPSPATIPKAAQRTITAGSLSKSHGLTSARVGWLTGPRSLLRPCVLNAIMGNALVPTPCQQIALTALRGPAEGREPIRKSFAARREYVFSRLQGMGLKPIWPGAGYFCWIPVGGSGRAFARELRQSKQVLVTPGDLFGPSGEECVRLSYAGDDGRLREGLRRLAEFLGSDAGAPRQLARAG